MKIVKIEEASLVEISTIWGENQAFPRPRSVTMTRMIVLWPSKDPLSQKELNAHRILIVRPWNSFLKQKKQTPPQNLLVFWGGFHKK